MAAVSADLEEISRRLHRRHWSFRRANLPKGARLSQLASSLADRRFDSPQIQSELINRQRPSSNTQAGVRDLMQAMISARQIGSWDRGLSRRSRSVQSVLASAGLHRDPGKTVFDSPNQPTARWDRAPSRHGRRPKHCSRAKRRRLRLAASTAFGQAALRNTPRLDADSRPGFVLANRDRLAIYSEGKFQADVDEYIVDILLQDEGLVSLRRVDVDAFRGAVLKGVASL